MFDTATTETNPGAAADWHGTLRWGDIVSFRFPLAERDENYRPKARPCLVLDIHEEADTRFVTLAYGTSAMTGANRGLEIHVRRPKVLAALGLDRPSRFVGARRVTVSVDDPGFCPGDRGTPLLARLDGAERDRVSEIRDRIRTTGEMWAETHAPRVKRHRTRRAPDGRRSRAKGCVVEHRRSRTPRRTERTR